MNLQNINWNELNTEVPDCFHDAVVQELDYQLSGNKAAEKRNHRKSGLLSRRHILPAAIAAAVAIGGTALAGPMAYSHLEDIFGWNRGEVAGLVQTSPETSIDENMRLSGDMTPELVSGFPALPSDDPLLDIRETLVDGAFLYVYADITQEGLKYDLGSDRIYLNDKETGPVEYWTDGSLAVFSVEVSREDVSSDFTVTLPLSVYAKDDSGTRYQNQEYTFSLPAVSDALSFQPDDQIYQLTDGISAQLESLAVSPTQLSFTIRYCLPESEADYAASLQSIVVKTPDGSSLASKSIFVNGQRSGSKDGCIYRTLEFAGSQGIPSGTQYLMIYPELADSPDTWHTDEALGLKAVLP